MTLQFYCCVKRGVVTDSFQVMLYHSHRFSAQYIDDFEELSFDIDMFKRNLERLVIVSASAQTLFSEIRRIYQWENPFTTIKWMALYFFLLHISHIMTFAVSSHKIPCCPKLIYNVVWLHNLRCH